MIRIKRPDSKNALSLINASKKEMETTLSFEVSEKMGSTIIRNIYECFRMLGDALLVKQGIESQDHLAPIKELAKINVKTSRPVNLVDNLRILRHNINYYGYQPKIEEIKDAINFAKSCFNSLFNEIIKIIGN